MQNYKNIKIVVAGTGLLVFPSNTSFAKHDAIAVDILQEATTDSTAAYTEVDFVIISVPTNYDSVMNYFDTSKVDKVISAVIGVNEHAVIVMKITVPVDYTKGVRKNIIQIG